MSYRVRHKLYLIASTDEDEDLVGFQRTADTVIQTIRTDATEGKAETREVAPSAADEDLEFGGIGPAKVLYVETDQALTLKLNGGTEVFNLTPTTGAKAKLFWEGNFTQVQVTNPSSTESAIVTFFIAG